MLYTVSKPLAIWFGTGRDMEAGSPLDRGFLIALLCLSLLILLKRQVNWFSAIRENIWLLFLIGYMLVSILWSDIPNISFRRWVRELDAVVMSFLVLSERNRRQALQSILRRAIYILIPFSLLLIKYYPKYGCDYSHWSGQQMWIGVTLHKNGLCLLCIISALFLIWTLIRRRQGRDIPIAKYQIYVEVFLLFLTLWILAGPQKTFTNSATSSVAFAVGLSAMAGLFWMKKRGLKLRANTLKVIVALIIVYGTVTPMVGGLSLLDVSSALGRDETLTGRRDIWSILVPLAMKQPLLGHGIGGFWTDAMRNLSASHAHNGYLEVLLSLGFVGLFLVFMFLLSCCDKAQRALSDDFDWGVLFICYLLMAVVHNITEPSINTLTSSMTAVILFFAISFSDVFSS